MTSSGAIERIARLYDEADRDAPADVVARLTALREQLHSPLRIAVAGRVKAGKSTVVNALLGRRICRTDARECTRVVTWFGYGPSERVMVVDRSGGRRRVALDREGLIPAELGIPADQIAAIEVELSLARLRGLTLADTPGLDAPDGSATTTTVEALGLDADSAAAIAAAETLLFVLNKQGRQTDVDVLRSFKAVSAGAGNDVLSAFAVLNKSDQFSGDDPFATGRRIAARLAEDLSDELAGVFAYSGLSAETAVCGVFTEADAVALEHLADLAPDRQQRLLSSPNTFARGYAEFTAAEAERLWRMLREFGVRELLAGYAVGARGAGPLKRKLLDSSGHDVVLAELDDLFTVNGVALKAAANLERLERLAWSCDGPWGEALRDRIEVARLDPALHVIAEANALRQVRGGDTLLPDDLQAEVARLVTTPVNERRAAPDGLRRWRERANTHSNPREAYLARTVARSYELTLPRETR